MRRIPRRQIKQLRTAAARFKKVTDEVLGNRKRSELKPAGKRKRKAR